MSAQEKASEIEKRKKWELVKPMTGTEYDENQSVRKPWSADDNQILPDDALLENAPMKKRASANSGKPLARDDDEPMLQANDEQPIAQEVVEVKMEDQGVERENQLTRSANEPVNQGLTKEDQGVMEIPEAEIVDENAQKVSGVVEEAADEKQ